MRSFLLLAYRSLRFRKTTVLLAVASITISTMLVLGVQRMQKDAKSSFQNTISNIDLIVGAKTGPLQLLMSTVFHRGFPSNNISYNYVTRLAENPEVSFVIPISLGDSHKGFRVIGTTPLFFEHYQYSNRKALTFDQGQAFDTMLDVVLGASVARKLGYKLDSNLVISHGIGETSFVDHDQYSFSVSGILAPTGTPIDQGVYVDLSAIEAIHLDHVTDTPPTPTSVTAAFVGLTNKVSIYNLQRSINTYRQEPLLAIIPGLTLYELWNTLALAEKTLWVVSIMVVLAGLLGLLLMLLTSMRERRFEMAVLRSLGATPWHIAFLYILESWMLTFGGAFLGMALVQLVSLMVAPMLQTQYGIALSRVWTDPSSWAIFALMGFSGLLVGLIPAALAYRSTLSQGLKAS